MPNKSFEIIQTFTGPERSATVRRAIRTNLIEVVLERNPTNDTPGDVIRIEPFRMFEDDQLDLADAMYSALNLIK